MISTEKNRIDYPSKDRPWMQWYDGLTEDVANDNTTFSKDF